MPAGHSSGEMKAKESKHKHKIENGAAGGLCRFFYVRRGAYI